MITVTNTSRRAQVYNLPHDVMCGEDKDSCTCRMHEHRQSSLNEKTGERGVRLIEQRISDSVHLMPGASVDLDDAAEEAPEIKSALARGEISIETDNA